MADAPTWFLGRGGQQFGPYTQAQLEQMAGQGQVQPADLVWQQGMPQWVQAQTLPWLRLSGPAATPLPGQPQGPTVDLGPLWDAVTLHASRAFTWNLTHVSVTDAERTELHAQGIDDDPAQRYLTWRRSILWVLVLPTSVTALFGLIGAIFGGADSSSDVGLSVLGVLMEIVRVLAYLVMPATAVAAAMTWSNLRLSRMILVGGWGIAFLVPLFIALFPLSWMLEFKSGTAEERRAASAVIGFLGGIAYYVMLMPTVLSLLPGVVRASLRIKSLLPASIVPGWFLVAATPLYILLFLITFVVINQMFGNALLLFGVFLLMAAPVVYLVYAPTFTRPLVTAEEITLLGFVQWIYRVISWVGVALLVLYALTLKFGDKSLIGFSDTSSILQPWSRMVWQFPIEYIARSMFTTTVVAELFMLINLSVWQQMRRFAATPESEAYDKMMGKLGQTLER